MIDSEGKVREIPIKHVIPDSNEVYTRPELSLNPKSSNGWGAFTKMFHTRWCVWVLAEPLELKPGEKPQLHFELWLWNSISG